MSRQITGYVIELNNLEIEIKRLSSQLKKLRARKKDIEEKVSEYLTKTGKPGVKYKGKTIVLKKKNKRVRKKEKERINDGSRILKEYGIHNAENVIKEVMEALKGEKEEALSLQYNKI
tara:strand:+ start:192 stop:545 length:354 start_codon:yes stop_codon:yes gene_type:complete